jgi:hypothetical protein
LPACECFAFECKRLTSRPGIISIVFSKTIRASFAMMFYLLVERRHERRLVAPKRLDCLLARQPPHATHRLHHLLTCHCLYFCVVQVEQQVS